MFGGPQPNEMLLFSPRGGEWLHFRAPKTVLFAHSQPEVEPLLREVERGIEAGLFAAGFLAYEAAPAFNPALTVCPARQGALLAWFGLYGEPQPVPLRAVAGEVDGLPGPWRAEVSGEVYTRAIQRIKEHIARGDTYQVNYTYRLRTPWHDGAAWPLFAALAAAHRPPYAAFVETEGWAVCSLSPELFFTQEGDRLTSRPMKGTAPRGFTLGDDRAQAGWLQASEKNRAENVMIVDMVRNDLGKIARTGSVCVPELFTVEQYPTVWQMTSTVQAESGAGPFEILQALYPAASITGAPKKRTMEIITELEGSPRGIYTGALGYFGPGRQALFNVAIRTLWIDKTRQEAEYGVGGGIVWDSEAGSEWEETHTKARVLSALPQPFELIETLRWTPEEGYFLLAEHLERLGRSAEYFAYHCDPVALRSALEREVASFNNVPQRVRVRLDRDGEVAVEAAPLQEAHPRRVALAKHPVDPGDRFLYHKTTRRAVYERALAEAPGFADVLLWNPRGELTESCTANLVAEIGGEWFTPPVSCGLLAGTHRARLLAEGRVRERVVRVDELPECARLFLVNSVRGMWEIEVEAGDERDPEAD